MVDARDITKNNEFRVVTEPNKKAYLVHIVDNKEINIPLKEDIEPYVNAIITLRDELISKLYYTIAELNCITREDVLRFSDLDCHVVEKKNKQIAEVVYKSLRNVSETIINIVLKDKED